MLRPSSKIFRLITRSILDNQDQVLQMMRWRIANQQYYASQPKITEESFRNWFDKYVFGVPKMLFWVLDDKGNPIGHMGLRFKEDACELDNVARGESGGKGRMGEALQALLKWVLKNVPTNKIYLRVLSTNDHAIAFYKKNGFVPKRKIIVRRGSPLRYLKMEYENSLYLCEGK